MSRTACAKQLIVIVEQTHHQCRQIHRQINSVVITYYAASRRYPELRDDQYGKDVLLCDLSSKDITRIIAAYPSV